MNDTFLEILNELPYNKPFLFVDSLLSVSENRIVGEYTFKKDEYFYRGHFIDNPITPGVILTECMAQIGLVSLGIYLLSDVTKAGVKIALSSSQIDFYQPVFPEETVTVHSEKVYFRFGKLKCNVTMKNKEGIVVCKGSMSGMIAK